MAKRLKDNLKKILAGAALAAFLSLPQVAYASNSQQKEKAGLSFIFGGRKGLGSNKSYGVKLGLKHGRFALVGDIPISSHPNINLEKTEKEMFGNVYFQGREDLKDFSSSIGASVEHYLPLARGISWVTGIGGKRRSYTRKVEENLVRRIGIEESLLASNINSIPKKEFVWNVYAGLSLELTNWLEVSPILGYETSFKKGGVKEKGMYISLRAIFPFGKGNR